MRHQLLGMFIMLSKPLLDQPKQYHNSTKYRLTEKNIHIL